MTFASQFRKDFLRTTQMNLGRAEHPIAIGLGTSTNDSRVFGAFGPDLRGGVRDWIEIPDPDHADLDLLRTALAQALMREWMRALPSSTAASNSPQDPPAWLLKGLARQIGAEHRLEDLDHVHAQWLHGRLPPVVELLTIPPPAALQHPALQAALAGWLLDHPGAPLNALLQRLVNGAAWSPVLVAEVLGALRNIAELNEGWDGWQANVFHEIRQVGVTTPGTTIAFRSQLLLYPGDYGLPMVEAWRGRTFSECLDWGLTPELNRVLRQKSQEVRLFSAGHDGALQQVAAAYAAFLDAFAKDGASDKVRALLIQAEASRKALEARAAKGEMLHDPVAVAPNVRENGARPR